MSTPPVVPGTPPPADITWTVVSPPVDAGFWSKQTNPALTWTVIVAPVDNGFWVPVVGDILDVNFILDESRLGGNGLLG